MQKKRRKSELKMCSPQIVLDDLFHYKRNMKNLEVEMNKLQERRITIEGQIDEAKTSGDVILDNVSEWINGAERLRQGVDMFIKEKTVKENVQCFKFSCPDFISRYRLSKEAEKKMGDVKSLSEKAHVDTISLPAQPPELQFQSSGEFKSLDSRASVFSGIIEALTDSKVNVIGVYGIGGVGKTTMVEKVGEQVKKDGLFDEVMMAVVSQDAKVVKIQGVLADHLNLKLEGETEVGRVNKLWNRLNNGKRNLVILDDVWKELNLKEIGIPLTDGNKGCKVVLTSRNQHVLKNMGVDKDWEIQVLSEQEAWNLLKKKMGNNVDSQSQSFIKISFAAKRKKPHDIQRAVCRECRGLPVAILAVGAALKGKSMYAWKSSLDKLRKSMLNNIDGIDQKLFISLRLSYDHLESTDAKSCFLLCCLFPEDAQVPIEEFVRHCMARRLLGQNLDTLKGARDIVCSVVNTLKTSCLLLDGKNDDFVKMHDIVRDVAISIAKEEKAFMVRHGVKEWPETGTYEKYSTISLRSETIQELPDELVCPGLHTLMLECSSSKLQREHSIKIPDRFFRGTDKLMVLELNRVTVLPLPSSLGKLMELRMLCLNECKLGDITILKDLKNNLEILRFRGSDIKALPLEVGELTRLQLLDLGDCDELEVIPNGVISKLYRLEELHFPRYFENWEGTTGNEEISKVSLDELMSLTRLSTLAIHIPNHRLLPKDLGFLNLIRFNITVGDQSPYVYTDGNYSSTVVMHLSGIDIDEDFNILERLLGKPGRGGLYPSRSFNYLTQLVLQDCRLKYLFSPSCARGLLQLQSLQIRASEIMEAVIGNEGEKDEEINANVIKFSQLKTLELLGLPRLISFYPQIKATTESHFGVPPHPITFNPEIKKATTEIHSFAPAHSLFDKKVVFPALEEVSIDTVPNITEIWDNNVLPTKSFCLLRSLKVENCKKLTNVVSSHMLPLLENIETLHVFNCLQMKVIIVLEKRDEETPEATNKDIIAFPKLRKMILRELENIEGLCDYKSEDQLNFNEQVPQPRNNTSIITETRRPMFNHQVAFSALEELYIRSVPNVTEIWDKNLLLAKSFCLLRSLKVSGCKKLMNVVPSHRLPLLKNIKTLEVSNCEEMEVIVVLEKGKEKTQEATNKDIILFPELREMTLENLKNLKGICANKSEDQLNFNVQFPQLRNLILNDLGRLSSFNNASIVTETQPLFNHQVAFPALEELSIVLVPNITEIWDKSLLPTEPYGVLRFLEIWDCKKLMNVVQSHMLPRLRNIEYLRVYNCREMEVIVVLEKREQETQEPTNEGIILFPELRTMMLRELEKLKAFCAYKSEDRPFNVQVVFPKLSIQDLDLDWHSDKIFRKATSS